MNTVNLSGKIISKYNCSKTATALTITVKQGNLVNVPTIIVAGRTKFKKGDFIELEGEITTRKNHKEPTIFTKKVKSKNTLLENIGKIGKSVDTGDKNSFAIDGEIIKCIKYETITILVVRTSDKKAFIPIDYYKKDRIDELKKGKKITLIGEIQTKRIKQKNNVEFFTNFVMLDFEVEK